MQTIQFDQAVHDQSHWSSSERDNVALITDFVQRLMNDHDFDHVLTAFESGGYRQHNRNLLEGIPGVVEYVQRLSKRYPDYAYDVKRIFADGDIVIFHSHVTIRKSHRGNDRKGFNIIDAWKVRDGEILDHWDAIQPLDAFMRFFVWLTGGAIRNGNGVF